MESDDSKEIKFLSVRVPMDLYKAASKKATDEELKFQQLVNDLLSDWVRETPAGASPLMNQLLKQQPTGADEELIRRFLAFWKNPKGKMEPHIRDLVAKALGVDPPK
jgi:hypothetical protein